MKISNFAESLLLAVLVVLSVAKAEVDSIEEVEKEPQVRNYICYSSVKYKSISLNCSTKIIKSAPKLNRSTCANKKLQV